MLASFKERMEAEGIDGKMYSHAIGDHGHAAGPTIGLADMNNQPVPVKGAPIPLLMRKDHLLVLVLLLLLLLVVPVPVLVLLLLLLLLLHRC